MSDMTLRDLQRMEREELKLDGYSDIDLIQALEKRGYRVRHRREGSTLRWSRTMPIPEGVSFPNEALDNLREQVTVAHLRFEERAPRGKSDLPVISAVLQIA